MILVGRKSPPQQTFLTATDMAAETVMKKSPSGNKIRTTDVKPIAQHAKEVNIIHPAVFPFFKQNWKQVLSRISKIEKKFG